MKNSIRQQVFRLLDTLPDIPIKDLYLEFKDCPKETIKTYRKQHRGMKKSIHNNTLDIKTELKKIIKDYKQPASARVQAIREYNNMVEITPEESEDPYLKYLKNKNSKTETITDIS